MTPCNFLTIARLGMAAVNCGEHDRRCRLRLAAIISANGLPGRNRIVFDIGSGMQTIRPRGGQGDARENVVAGNLIGTDATGNPALGNGRHGVLIFLAQFNRIGGSAPGDSNVICANGFNGVAILGPNPDRPDFRRYLVGENGTFVLTSPDGGGAGAKVMGNEIFGNRIGVDSQSTAALGNERAGIFINCSHENVVDGALEDERNIISGNRLDGVSIRGAPSVANRVIGNYIGTGADGATQLANARFGVLLAVGADRNAIGGDRPGEENLIAPNGKGAVRDSGAGSLNAFNNQAL